MIKEDLIIKLAQHKILNWGSFRLKSGILSPFYIDLRNTFFNVELMKEMIELLVPKLQSLSFDVIVGIPDTATFFAVLLADRLKKPFIGLRKEEKTHGTKGVIIGKYTKGDTCLIIDDVITTGESKLQTAQILQREGLKVENFVVFIDRSASGEEVLKQNGYNLISLFHIKEIVDILLKYKLINTTEADEILQFTISLQRQEKNILAERIRQLIEIKKSNLILSLDVSDTKKFLALLKLAGPYIVAVKTHMDIFTSPAQVIPDLIELARTYNFAIIEDRKFADIGPIVYKQFHEGPYRISSWADGVTAHAIAGKEMLKALYTEEEDGGIFLIAAMSSKDNLITSSYTDKVLLCGASYIKQVAGYIGAGRSKQELQELRKKIPFAQLLAVPGVSLEEKMGVMGQTYIPYKEALEGGSDVVIVGKDIYERDIFEDVAQRLQAYRTIYTKWLDAK